MTYLEITLPCRASQSSQKCKRSKEERATLISTQSIGIQCHKGEQKSHKALTWSDSHTRPTSGSLFGSSHIFPVFVYFSQCNINVNVRWAKKFIFDYSGLLNIISHVVATWIYNHQSMPAVIYGHYPLSVMNHRMRFPLLLSCTNPI